MDVEKNENHKMEGQSKDVLRRVGGERQKLKQSGRGNEIILGTE